MPLYHFHIQDGHSIPDQTGTECVDDVAAREVAVDKFSAMIHLLGKEFWNGYLWQMKVVDATGRRVVTLRTRGHVMMHS